MSRSNPPRATTPTATTTRSSSSRLSLDSSNAFGSLNSDHETLDDGQSQRALRPRDNMSQNGKSKGKAKAGDAGPAGSSAARSRNGASADVESDAKNVKDRKGRRRIPPLSLTLQNTGSVARDHLASERTFLAYVRTSLAFASAGVALVQLFTISTDRTDTGPGPKRYARPIGATVVIFGMFVLAVGTTRYFTIQNALPQGHFPAARVTVFVHALVLAALVGAVFGIVVAIR
ncbi:hypothetical protein FA95DRAFT_1567397 [Auriscalpium vulgare]|uniref:Uncharacterized protein n=1 Tax=Auriscalpium vulgare TaxID=40419 RepID=A0ACB8R513_9AGAM|nr:hypothetical protein FA95DRAFT_1567397 [Auriscalpium vulgare]